MRQKTEDWSRHEMECNRTEEEMANSCLLSSVSCLQVFCLDPDN
jgi:hypothetical protein